ncbi:MAG TPA: benzoate-CoA ligase family protein [Vicinamibacterales bacterium]|nr:benzoate-CoA ligase family protein [Vicinamibacterales bacterium]
MAIPDRFNVADYLVARHVREGRGDRVALLTDDGTTTYAALEGLVNRAGNALKQLGVLPEQRVALVLHDGLSFYAGFLGAILIGAVPVPINTLLRRADFHYILDDAGAVAAIVSGPILDELLPVDGFADLTHVLVSGAPAGGLPSFEALVAASDPALAPANTHRDDPAFWLYSSGSTGRPKGAVHLQHDIICTIDGYARGVLGMTEEDRCLSAARLFFAYGLGNSLSFPLGVGGQAALVPERPTPEGMFQAIQRFRPTIFFAVPTLFAAMLQVDQARTRFDLSSLRFCVSAGEALPAEIFARWRDRFGLEIIDGIGSTEMLHIFLSNRPGSCRPGTSGVEVPGYSARIVGEDGSVVPRGTVGTLLVSGDSAAAYYWRQHEKTKRTFQGEWVDTGDKYVRDDEGCYRYCGRSDDMLKVNGLWVSPVEVEHAVMAHPGVLECAVVGASGRDGLTKPKAFVVLRQEFEASAAIAPEIQAAARARLPSFKCPSWIEFLPELPKTATGKIQRFRLR